MALLSWLLLDFETRSRAKLKDVGAWRYAEDPSTEILCLSWQHSDGRKATWFPGQEAGDLWDFATDDSCTFIAFNVQFEKAIWKNLMVKLGLPALAGHRWHDIQAVCGMKGLPQALADAIDALSLPVRKDMEGSKYVISLSKPDKKSGVLPVPDLPRVRDYCEQDIGGELCLHSRVGFLPPGERKVWLVNQRLNERGLRLDMEFINAAKKVVERAATPLVAEFRDITGGLVPTQTAKFVQWCKAQGAKVDNLRKETVSELIEEDEDVDTPGDNSDSDGLPNSVRRALVIRSLTASSAVKKLDRMAITVCGDGRSRGLLHYHGTGPGRAAGRLWQPHNLPRPTVKIDKATPDPEYLVSLIKTGDPDAVELGTGYPAIQVVAHSLRHAIVAEPGRTFISGDYAGIQLRVLLALAGQYDKCDILSKGLNAYCDMGKTIYGREIDKHKDIAEYTLSKNAVLGLGFQMSAKTFHAKYAKEHPIEFLENLVDIYRQQWAPLVPKLWYGLERASSECVHYKAPREHAGIEFQLEDDWLTMRLPSGRKIWYFRPEPCQGMYGPAWRYHSSKGPVRVFGGLITENAVMGIECDFTRNAAINLENEEFPNVLEVHDEIVVEVAEAKADTKKVKEIMERLPKWNDELHVPIEVECWQGKRYRK